MPSIFTIIDTETTGMRPGFARVMDIGIIRVENGAVVERFQSLVNPGHDVPNFISSFTGITSDMLVDAPQFEEIAIEVERLLKDSVFVAHNASFDYGFIKAEFARIGMDWQAESLCTVRLSRALYPRERSHSLDSVMARHDIRISDRHRALPDAEAVLQFLEDVCRTLPKKLVKGAVTAVRDGVIPALGKDSFAELPKSPGVYMFYGPEQELLYVGKSKNIRTRARSHFSPGTTGADLRYNTSVTSVQAVTTSGELSALILESAMVKQESPIYNRMLRRRKVLVIAKRVRDESGYDRVALEKCDDIQADGTVLSVFRTMTQGKEVLRTLAKKNQICEKMLGIESTKGPHSRTRECFARQLEQCDGACIGQLAASDHNLRITEAFKKRRIISWPYAGPIMVKESETDSSGTIFLIDNWALVGAYTYQDSQFQSLVQNHAFDYDTYKILARYLRKRANRRAVQVLSRSEFEKIARECRGEVEEVIC